MKIISLICRTSFIVSSMTVKRGKSKKVALLWRNDAGLQRVWLVGCFGNLVR